MGKSKLRSLNEEEARTLEKELECTKARDDNNVHYVYKTNGFNVYIQQQFIESYPIIDIYYNDKNKTKKLDIEYFKDKLPDEVKSKIKGLKIEKAYKIPGENEFSNINNEAKITFHIPKYGVDKSENIPVVKAILDAVTSELTSENFVHACGDCHSITKLNTYSQEAGLITLCETCWEKRRDFAKEKTSYEYMAANERVFRGTLVTLAVGIVCFILVALLKWRFVELRDYNDTKRAVFLYLMGVILPTGTNFLMGAMYYFSAGAYTARSALITLFLTLLTVVAEYLYLVQGGNTTLFKVEFFGIWLVTLIIITSTIFTASRDAEIPIKVNV